MNGIKRARSRILKAKTILIAGHVNPDGDSIGSLLSLGLGLKELGKRVYMLSSDGVPLRYRSLPGASGIVKKVEGPVDLAIAVDCSSRDILGANYIFFGGSRDILEIDHHEFRRPFGTLAIVDKYAAAVGEIIYELLKSLKVRITKDVAQNLLTSIIVETNSFRLPNVRPFTFDVCNRLISNGVDFYKLVDMVFWSKRKEAALLSGLCLSKCRFIYNDTIAWSIISRKDYEEAGGTEEDVDAVPDEMRSIRTVKVAVLFREDNNGTIRVSLRSKGKINVAAVAEHYNGGGHFDVAGCTIPNNRRSIDEFLDRVKRLLIKGGKT